MARSAMHPPPCAPTRSRPRAPTCATSNVRWRHSSTATMPMSARASDMRKHLIALPALVALCTMSLAHAQAAVPGILEIFDVLPAPAYDPYTSQIPRRRPGHTYEPLPEFNV